MVLSLNFQGIATDLGDDVIMKVGIGSHGQTVIACLFDVGPDVLADVDFREISSIPRFFNYRTIAFYLFWLKSPKEIQAFNMRMPITEGDKMRIKKKFPCQKYSNI